jgi:hypothetical protein
MQDRFTLRFQNGDREGESVSITSPRFTLGRRPGNTIQIQDASVSGHHAELLVSEDGVMLRDLDSTNGTRIGGRKISEGRPAHGDLISFGGINAVFEDGQFLESSPGASAGVAGPSAVAGGAETIDVVTAEMVARSRKTSKPALIGVTVLVLAGGAAAAFFLTGGGGQRSTRVAPVAAVPGNKLASYSFEDTGAISGWSTDEAAPASFDQRRQARVSGENGMRAILAAGEWALLTSDPVGVSIGRSVEISARLRAGAGVAGRVGVEFLPREDGSPENNPGASVAWSAWIGDVSRHQDVSLVAGVPSGAARARVLIEGRAGGELRPLDEVAGDDTAAATDSESGGGSVDVDDVSLVDSSQLAEPVAKLGEYALWLHGERDGAAQLTKVSRTLISDLHAVGEMSLRDWPLSAEALPTGFRLSAEGADALSLRIAPSTWSDGLATVGPNGLIEHTPEFEAPGTRVLLLGTGHGLVALVFERPALVTGRREEVAGRLLVQLTGSVTVQVDFREERARAGDLAFAARNAQTAGNLGECLARWNELLATAPYEAKLVQEARATRTRLEQAGLIELAEVEEAFERARFFRLVDLYRQCRARAHAVGAKYAGSAVEVQASALVAQVEGSLGELEVDLSKDEVERLKSILNVLEQTESPGLASEVRQYLRTEYGVQN